MTYFIVVRERNNCRAGIDKQQDWDLNQMLKDRLKNMVKKGVICFFIHFVRFFILTTEIQLFIWCEKSLFQFTHCRFPLIFGHP